MQDDPMERVQSKIAYLEQAVAEISDAVFRQHRDIQALEMQLKAIRDRLAGQADEPRTLEQERPPHY
jgi:uncharacterized coiled-coil protein SlyX